MLENIRKYYAVHNGIIMAVLNAMIMAKTQNSINNNF